MTACVKVCGCRPHAGGAAHTGAGVRNLQGMKPREVWSGRASDAMGISTSAVFGRGSLTAALGRDREGDEAGRSIAVGRTAVARRNTNGKRAVQCGTQA